MDGDRDSAGHAGASSVTELNTPGGLVPTQLSVASAWMDIALAGVAMLFLYYVLEPLIWSESEEPRVVVSALLLGRTLSMVVIAGVASFLVLSRGLSWRTIGIRREGLDSQIMAAVCAIPLMYVALAVSAGLVLLVVLLLWPPAGAFVGSRGWMDPLRAEQNIDVAIAFMAATAIMEETLFRGVLLTRLRRVLGGWWSAVLVSGVCFGAIHLEGGGIGQALSAVFVSLVLARVFIRSRSLLTVVLLHFLFNCIQLIWPRVIGL